MTADALAPYVARTSAAMILTYVEYVGPGLTWGRILSACVISMWRNDTECKYMFMFPLKNLARKGLRQPFLKMDMETQDFLTFKGTWLYLSWYIDMGKRTLP